MKPLIFKTNIKCAGCVAQVKPHLNEVAGEDQWAVDLENPEKILTVGGDNDEAAIKEAVQKAGFTAEKV